jgi:PEP-CTERM motif
MKVALRAISLVACTALVLAIPSIAHAQISATVYEGIPDPGNSGDVANQTAANATFDISGTTGINFQSALTSYSNITQFLNNPTYLTESATFDPNASVDNTELVITGSTFLAAGENSFVVGHDDGVVLTMPGIGTGSFGNIVNEPGPTSLNETNFNVDNTGAAGEFAFVLDYAECCGAPADLVFTINGAPITTTVTPEPSSFIMLGSGLLACAGMVRRRLMA